MIYVYTKSGFQPYHFIPKKVRKKYETMDETLCILESKAQSQRSRFYYQTWDEAVYSAWEEGLKNGSSQHMGVMLQRSVIGPRKWENINISLIEFLTTQQNKHLWSSDNRFDKSQPLTQSNVLTKKYKKKAEKADVYKHYQIEGITEELEFIHTPFLRMFSPKITKREQFTFVAQAHEKNSAMNCEQFVCYALCCSGALKEDTLKTIYLACGIENKMDLLYEALGFQKAQPLGNIHSYISLGVPSLLFEKNQKGKVAHMLIYDGVQHIFELAIGAKENEWRVKQITLENYLQRQKTVVACKLENMPVEAVLEKINKHHLDKSPQDLSSTGKLNQ